ncbi:MAG: glycosyl hydrolase family 28 protein [Planctomycetia bacterium]|nr:glycosyl hydrolase family 28 protein [Planctomycetia bacterium]
MKHWFPLFLTSWTLCLSVWSAENVVKTWPAPEGEKVTGVYTVTVDGKPVDVYAAQSEYFEGDYYFAYFDFSGKVTVDVKSSFPMAQTELLPQRFGFSLQKSADSVQFVADKPFRVSIEPNGRIKPLLLFGNALETDVPQPNDPNVRYFGPGVHKADKITLSDNQTLYLAGGAVVHGSIQATGKNITIRGRGILTGESYPRFSGPGRFPLYCQNCENVVVRDIILRDPWSWTAVTWNCDGVLIDGLKICGSRMLNDDALDLVNTQNAVVRNCFFRSQDDCIAIKGKETSRQPCENILIEDCQFWVDVANIYRIGYECDTETMKNIVSRRIDVLHYSKNFHPLDYYWVTAIFWLQPNLNMLMEECHFEDVVIHSNGSPIHMLMAKPMRCFYGPYKKDKNFEPGRVRNCTFKNVRVVGKDDSRFKGTIFIQGDSPKHSVEGLKFENITYFGTPITKDSECVQIGNHSREIEFSAP